MKNKNKLIFAILFCIIIAVILYAPYLLTDYINNGTDISYHLSRIDGLATSIKQGNWFPKIYLFKNNGYGYAWPAFYCDIFLIIPALAYNFGLSLINSYKLAMFIPVLLTSFIAFFGAKTISSSKIYPYISAVTFTGCYVFINDIFLRSGLGSVWAWPFLVLVLFGIINLLWNDENKTVWMLTAGFTGLALSHNISFFFGVLLFVLVIALNVKTIIKDVKKIKTIIIAALLAFGLCAYFLIPMLELKLGQALIMDQNYSYEAYKQTFVPLAGTLKDVMKYFLIIICLAFIIEKKDKDKRRIYLTLCLLIISMFFILASSEYLNLPLTFTQFKSRTLPIARLCYFLPLSLYISLIIDKYLNNKIIRYLVIGVLIFSVSNTAYESLKFIESYEIKFDSEDTLDDVLSYYIGYNSTVDTLIIDPDVDWLYLPASLNYDYTAKPCVVSLEERKNITCDVKKNTDGSTEIQWNSANTISNNILFPVSYYKGYKAHLYDVNGNEKLLNVMGDWNTGLVLVNVPEDFREGRIVVSYDGTKLQLISAVASILTLLGIVFYWIKKWGISNEK